MKKISTVLILLSAVAMIVPFTGNAAESAVTVKMVSNAPGEVTIVKKTGNGYTTVKRTVKYVIVDGDIYVISGGKQYKAEASDMAGYAYCVDLGGRNNVWYFNLN